MPRAQETPPRDTATAANDHSRLLKVYDRMDFKMNPGAEKAIADMAVKALTARYQPILDGLHAEYSGRPVEVIKPVLAQRWAEGNTGASITEPDLTNVAQAISEGRQIRMVDGRLTTD